MRRSWHDLFILVIALWLWISPFALAFVSASTDASANAFLVGAGVLLIATLGLATAQRWEEWTSLVLAAWLIASPWVIGYADNGIALWNAVISGGLIVVVALIGIVQRSSGGPLQPV